MQVLDALDGGVVQQLLAEQTLAHDEVGVGQIRQSLKTHVISKREHPLNVPKGFEADNLNSKY